MDAKEIAGSPNDTAGARWTKIRKQKQKTSLRNWFSYTRGLTPKIVHEEHTHLANFQIIFGNLASST